MTSNFIGGSKTGLMIGLLLLAFFFLFIIGVTASGAYFLNVKGSKTFINKLLNSESRPIITNTNDSPNDFKRYFFESGIMEGQNELYISSDKDQVVYLVKYDNGYYQFYMRDAENNMNIHPDGQYKIYNELREVISYFNSGIEQIEDLGNYIALTNGSFITCDVEDIQSLFDRVISKHPENTITKKQMSYEIESYFINFYNSNLEEKDMIKEMSKYFLLFVDNFLNNIESCELYKFKDDKVEEFTNLNSNKKTYFFILLILFRVFNKKIYFLIFLILFRFLNK